MPVLPVLRKLRQEDHKSEASRGYTARPCLKKNKFLEHNKWKANNLFGQNKFEQKF
jgi:hypothetical protein